MTELLALPEFDKDVKKISKKYQSLHDDLDRLYKALKLIRLNDIRGTVRISDLGEIYKDYPVYKLKSFRCASLHHKRSSAASCFLSGAASSAYLTRTLRTDEAFPPDFEQNLMDIRYASSEAAILCIEKSACSKEIILPIFSQ